MYLGRFQPFHLGHLDALKEILKREKHVIIVIGSAEDHGTLENPFTAGERYTMIESALEEAGISHERYAIIPVRDIHNDEKWVEHVERLTPSFDTVYTGSQITKKLFKKYKKYQVIDLKKHLAISATMVRNILKLGKEKNLEELVPKAVANIVERIIATR